ncbi:YggS family pyridoxal phosphate enzyme [Spizellomyces punctatus DAOM BR117]|uniref:Pyridoxal phosphate homeostasis protein n=1 Tax=Spizellomyces punctatus (strain DAOM BR117) TaxID=645134 RepID=A0A0L0HIG2_SPIPD|nr:YggS family pyridoxal phosphate enzyme [Spizellomyces punctatus DAOM BR117]KND00917.1 YggS family pyridoxal phosphate enzyme [Spizellomyces punctatus DAOM BR117]|eukprot:XP_016608956.1 YggS family pyridoxal phosphate enzyme [Spizellomyces punctatus DAOM BR117]
MSTCTNDQQARKSDITCSLAEIRERVKQAEQKRGTGKEVRLVAVSKTKPASDLLIAYEAGQRHFGENVQELVEKAAQLPTDICWHFIGTLQSNKCKTLAAVPNLWAVETIDSIKKADMMNKAWSGKSQPLRVFVQVNTSGEESKSGLHPTECIAVAEHVVTACQNLTLQGLMTIGSPDRDAESENPDFVCLKQCKDTVDQKLGLDVELSMGMSDDFENAIHAGATNVRVGSSIFGSRNYAKR